MSSELRFAELGNSKNRVPLGLITWHFVFHNMRILAYKIWGSRGTVRGGSFTTFEFKDKKY